MMIAAVLTVISDLTHGGSKLVAIGKTSATVAVASKRLRRKKAGASDCAQIARESPFVSRSKALGGVFDNGKTMCACDGIDFIHLGALSIERHRHDRACSRRD